MWVGIGIGINRNRYAQGIFNAYSARVVADGGVVEAGQCVNAVTGLLLNASLLLIPSGYKANKLYSEIPTNGNGDLSFTRASNGTRINSSGLIESMGSGVPRLTYQNGGGGCPSLLLEKQSTNLFTYSAQLDDVNWSKQNCTITANSSTAPDGTLSADLVDDGTAVSTQHWFFQSPTLANSTAYTISFYAKYVSRKNMTVNIYNGSTSRYVVYDIQNGVIVGSTGDVTASITSVGNGWYRVVYTRTMASSGSPNFRIAMADDTGSESYTGSNKQVLIWGLQLEASSYPTSYIPTTSSSATRVADACYKTGISSLIGQTEGVVFWDGVIDNFANYGTCVAIDGTNNSWIYLITYSLGFSIEMRNNGTVAASYSPTNSAGRYKIAMAYNSSQFVVYINGSLVHTDNSVTVPATSAIYLSDFFSYNQLVKTNQVALFKTRLTNAELATLTTL